ncbi:MAG TPA: HupE/UreJ family protein [Gammaproteobacteria bacterium]|nr:HupE/UreJ family protein [Gammaproteobacteria bacterium]
MAAAVLLLLATSSALAHDPSRSLLKLAIEGDEVHGRLDVSLRDLEDAVGLDADGDYAITWREVEQHRDDVERYARQRLAIAADGAACALGARLGSVDLHGGATYAVLDLRAECPTAPRRLRVDYGLMFDVDGAHRSLLEIGSGAAATTAVLSAEHPSLEVEVAKLSAWSSLGRFVAEGVWHIWHGYDHLAFVLLLLVPIVLGARRAEELGVRAAAAEILRVVTAFTLAHSLTLALATLGIVNVPSRLIESAIALSVLIAALSNVAPRVPRLGARLAFCFGLVHGLGFATALRDLGTDGAGMLVSLAGFNLGVEAGQLAVVSAVMPVLFAVRSLRGWPPQLLKWSCSAACGGLAVVWIVQRLPM